MLAQQVYQTSSESDICLYSAPLCSVLSCGRSRRAPLFVRLEINHRSAHQNVRRGDPNPCSMPIGPSPSPTGRRPRPFFCRCRWRAEAVGRSKTSVPLSHSVQSVSHAGGAHPSLPLHTPFTLRSVLGSCGSLSPMFHLIMQIEELRV